MAYIVTAGSSLAYLVMACMVMTYIVMACSHGLHSYGWLKPGAHINAVGSCNPRQRELDEACVTAGAVFCF